MPKSFLIVPQAVALLTQILRGHNRVIISKCTTVKEAHKHFNDDEWDGEPLETE